MGADNLIKINNLSFAYNKNTPPLLKNVNLDIPKGVYLSIVGENGSCKTTLIKLILGLLTLDPKSSSIDVLEKVNMLKFKENLIGNLSGGQQQRVFIARALIGNPDLIILDEPSTGVDVKNQQEIYSLLSKINKEQGTTIISIEHNMDIALKYSTHILTINNGKLTLQSNKDFRENYTLPGA